MWQNLLDVVRQSESVGSSPRHSSCSLPRPSSAAVVVVESAFSRLHVQSSHTTHVLNYDRSEVTTTLTRHRDGIETMSEVVAWPDGRVTVHELVRNMSMGKTSMLLLLLIMNAVRHASHTHVSVESQSMHRDCMVLPVVKARRGSNDTAPWMIFFGVWRAVKRAQIPATKEPANLILQNRKRPDGST